MFVEWAPKCKDSATDINRVYLLRKWTSSAVWSARK